VTKGIASGRERAASGVASIKAFGKLSSAQKREKGQAKAGKAGGNLRRKLGFGGKAPAAGATGKSTATPATDKPGKTITTAKPTTKPVAKSAAGGSSAPAAGAKPVKAKGKRSSRVAGLVGNVAAGAAKLTGRVANVTVVAGAMAAGAGAAAAKGAVNTAKQAKGAYAGTKGKLGGKNPHHDDHPHFDTSLRPGDRTWAYAE
jgi:hypothetical protein